MLIVIVASQLEPHEEALIGRLNRREIRDEVIVELLEEVTSIACFMESCWRFNQPYEVAIQSMGLYFSECYSENLTDTPEKDPHKHHGPMKRTRVTLPWMVQ